MSQQQPIATLPDGTPLFPNDKVTVSISKSRLAIPWYNQFYLEGKAQGEIIAPGASPAIVLVELKNIFGDTEQMPCLVEEITKI